MLTPSEVKDGFPTTVPDAEIQAIIDMLSDADDCLSKRGVTPGTQTLLKLYAVRHLLTLQANQGKGSVRSQSAPSGASQSFANWQQGEGLNASAYGSMLRQLDRFGCVTRILENDKQVFLFAVGRG